MVSVILFFLPPPEGYTVQVMRSAAVILLAIGLWSTAVLPSAFSAIIFLFLCIGLSIAPAKVVFSGFHSGATWLVFGGLILGLAVKKTGLDMRFVRSLIKNFPRSYTGMIYGVFWISLVFAFVLPSASGRVAVLVPIMAALAKELGFIDNSSKGRTGLILAASMGTMVPAFTILPANVPNMALYGAADSILNIQLSYSEYFILNFPVMGMFPLIVYPAIIAILFKDTPNYKRHIQKNTQWGNFEKRLSSILLVAFVFWVSDSFHNISPAWVALGASILCLLPMTGILKPQVLGSEINYGPFFFLAGVIGLGSLANNAGLGTIIADSVSRVFDFQQGEDFLNYVSISFISMLVGLFTTMPAQPSIMVSMTSVFSDFTGWTQTSVIMATMTAWGIFPFFYQAPPLVVAVALGNLRVIDVTRMLCIYMLFGVLFMLPLHFLWGRIFGKFIVGT